ncbi:uncharacterized protein LOC121415380 [Lytechinus variegatus]|uniref:uncharacterized protein LOC121415380 n=1 Tax=Lytechinus variegatus TaxID=7654 RepID=UPI001BB12B46|nr:uncharacterized protein LOC121415380 [Lytechinus variegatus]
MTMAFSKDKINRNTKVMRSFRLHRITAICIIVTLLLVDHISWATETVIVRERSFSVADVPNSEFYPGSGAAVTPSFYRLLEFHDNRGNKSNMFVGGKNVLLELRLDSLSLIREIVVPKYAVGFSCDDLQDSEVRCVALC